MAVVDGAAEVAVLRVAEVRDLEADAVVGGSFREGAFDLCLEAILMRGIEVDVLREAAGRAEHALPQSRAPLEEQRPRFIPRGTVADQTALGQQRERVVEHDLLVSDLVADLLALRVLADEGERDHRRSSSRNASASTFATTP